MAASKVIMGTKIIPTPQGWPLIGTLGSLIAAGGASKLHEYVHSRHKQLGPIYKEKIGPVSATFVSSPEYMRKVFALEGKYPAHVIPESWVLYNQIYGHKRGLLFMEGEEWHKFRKILNGVILKPESNSLSRAVTVAAEDLTSKWIQSEKITNLESHMYHWALQSIIAILLGADKFRPNKDSLHLLVNQLANGLHNIFIESGKLSLISAKMAQQFKLPVWRRFVKAIDSSFNTAGILMEKIEKIGPDSDGLLRHLLDTNIKHSDLIRIVLDLILAAGDTTAYTSQWLLYKLCQDQELQQYLYEEIKNLEYCQAADNALLKSLLRETLRMYPVAPFVTRYMPRDVDIDGYLLNKGDLVIMSLYTSGRDSDCFPDSNQFQPLRWLRDGQGYRGVRNPYASLPFAMGARSCIGKKIAETQITTTLAMILKTMQISQLKKTDIQIKLNLIAVPSAPIELKIQKRLN